MTTHTQFVVDIEATARTDNGVVTRIAITPFRFNEGVLSYEELFNRTLYICIDQGAQRMAGRKNDESTDKWWSEQTEELRIQSLYPTDDDISVENMFGECKRFLSRWNYHYTESFLWARNCGYEYGKLSHLNEQFMPGSKHVFNPWGWHECKTFNYILTGGDTQKFSPVDGSDVFMYHNARHDSARDAQRLIELWHQS